MVAAGTWWLWWEGRVEQFGVCKMYAGKPALGSKALVSLPIPKLSITPSRLTSTIKVKPLAWILEAMRSAPYW